MSQKYKSKYGAISCTAKQYICEILMERKYHKQNIKLPAKFWNLDKYKKEYQQQIIRINQLTKLYDEEVVVQTIIANKWLYSLFFPKIHDLLEKQEKLWEQQEKKIESSTEITGSTEGKGRLGKTRKIASFKKLD